MYTTWRETRVGQGRQQRGADLRLLRCDEVEATGEPKMGLAQKDRGGRPYRLCLTHPLHRLLHVLEDEQVRGNACN
jgi:hypothetical protein